MIINLILFYRDSSVAHGGTTKKPASLLGSRRKSSTLDAVIGKLMESANASHPIPYNNEFGDSGEQDFVEPSAKRLCVDNIFEQLSGDNFDSDTITKDNQDSNSSDSGQRLTSKGSEGSLSSVQGGSGEGGGSLKLVIKRTDIKFPTGNGGQRPLSSLGSKINPMKRPSDLVAKQQKMRDSPILKRSLSGSNMTENPAVNPGLGSSNTKTSTPDKLRPDLEKKGVASLKQHLSETMPGSKFDMLKEKIREKKLKKTHDIKPEKIHGISSVLKTPTGAGKSEKQILSPHAKMPKSAVGLEKKAPVPPSTLKGGATPIVPGAIYPGVDIFPGGKTLKSFKIPKIEDSQKPPPATAATTPTQPPAQQQQPLQTTPSKLTGLVETGKKPDEKSFDLVKVRNKL